MADQTLPVACRCIGPVCECEYRREGEQNASTAPTASWPCPHDPAGTSPYACACEDG